MSFTPWSNAYDLRFPVAWWDAEGDVVTVEATGVVRLRTTDAGASYTLFVSVPAGAATVAPDGTHTLGGVAGYRVQVNDAADGSGTWSNYNTGGYTDGWLQNTVPRAFAFSSSILPNGGSPGAVRVQVLTPTPAGTPTGDVLAEVTTASTGGAFVTVGEDVGPRVLRKSVVYNVTWQRGSFFFPVGDPVDVPSVIEAAMTSYKGIMYVFFNNTTGPPEPTGWFAFFGQSSWKWLPVEDGSGTFGTRQLTLELDSTPFNSVPPIPGATNFRVFMESNGVGSENAATVFYDGEFDVTEGQFFTPLEFELPPVQTRPLVSVRLSTRNAIDGGTP